MRYTGALDTVLVVSMVAHLGPVAVDTVHALGMRPGQLRQQAALRKQLAALQAEVAEESEAEAKPAQRRVAEVQARLKALDLAVKAPSLAHKSTMDTAKAAAAAILVAQFRGKPMLLFARAFLAVLSLVRAS